MVAIIIFGRIDLVVGGKIKGKGLLMPASKLEMLIQLILLKQIYAKEKEL